MSMSIRSGIACCNVGIKPTATVGSMQKEIDTRKYKLKRNQPQKTYIKGIGTVRTGRTEFGIVDYLRS